MTVEDAKAGVVYIRQRWSPKDNWHEYRATWRRLKTKLEKSVAAGTCEDPQRVAKIIEGL